MPRTKSDNVKTSQELDAEIKAMQEKIAAKKKAMAAAKKKEDAEDRRNRELAEREFNRQFVEKSKVTKLQSGRTVYEWIKSLMEQPVQADNSESGFSLGEISQIEMLNNVIHPGAGHQA